MKSNGTKSFLFKIFWQLSTSSLIFHFPHNGVACIACELVLTQHICNTVPICVICLGSLQFYDAKLKENQLWKWQIYSCPYTCAQKHIDGTPADLVITTVASHTLLCLSLAWNATSPPPCVYMCVQLVFVLVENRCTMAQPLMWDFKMPAKVDNEEASHVHKAWSLASFIGINQFMETEVKENVHEIWDCRKVWAMQAIAACCKPSQAKPHTIDVIYLAVHLEPKN